MQNARLPQEAGRTSQRHGTFKNRTHSTLVHLLEIHGRPLNSAAAFHLVKSHCGRLKPHAFTFLKLGHHESVREKKINGYKLFKVLHRMEPKLMLRTIPAVLVHFPFEMEADTTTNIL